MLNFFLSNNIYVLPFGRSFKFFISILSKFHSDKYSHPSFEVIMMLFYQAITFIIWQPPFLCKAILFLDLHCSLYPYLLHFSLIYHIFDLFCNILGKCEDECLWFFLLYTCIKFRVNKWMSVFWSWIMWCQLKYEELIDTYRRMKRDLHLSPCPSQTDQRL